MKVFARYGVATLLLQLIFAVPHQATTSNPLPAQVQDVSLLRPTDIAYQDAAEFAQFLKTKGVEVRSIHRSTLEGFFKGIEKAAFFRTDKGIVEAIFFPGPLDAEQISITYRRNDSKVVPHRYKVEGQPVHGEGVIHAANPIYFTLHRSWYIVTLNAEMDVIVKRLLGQRGLR